MDISKANFVYNATIKLSELPPCKAQLAYPGVSDLALNSREFSSYTECVDSAKGLMEGVMNDLNTQNAEQFTVSAEVNPARTGIETRSRDWGDDELARLWIFNKKEEGAVRIHAFAQARIFFTPRAQPAARLN